VVARRRHAARHLSSITTVQMTGALMPTTIYRAQVAAVGQSDPGQPASRALVNCMDPAAFQGLNSTGEARDRISGAYS